MKTSTWLLIVGAEVAATAMGPEWKFAEALASGVVAGGLAGTTANEFKENDKEPSISISIADAAGAGTSVVGAAVQRLGK